MKMAKASEADLSMALDLISVLDDIERGYFPHRFSDPESESIEWLDTTNRLHFAELIDNLRRLLNRGSICRVIMGMAVVCDPSNECIDPDADTIEHHPKRQQMEKQRDDLLAALEGLHKVCEIALAGKYGEQHTYFETRACHFVEASTAMRAAEDAIASVKGNHSEQSLDMVTSAPAIVFYPAGSLGEYVDSEGGAA